MNETVGTLNLKIARLEQQLQIIRQQQRLSSRYPEHWARLSRQGEQLQHRLSQLSVMEHLLNDPLNEGPKKC